MIPVFLGLITGFLIGLTGTGGGVLLTPMLMLLTPLHAVVIIGTDIINGAVTKLVGVIEHRRLGQIQWKLAGLLISGSVPGTLAGIALIRYLKAAWETGQLDHFLRGTLGFTLLGVAVLLPFIAIRRQVNGDAPASFSVQGREGRIVAVGALVGFMVALTSIGSGSLMMAFLLLLVPLPIAELVGTDILFGLATMTLAGSFHFWMGHFSAPLFIRLLAGAVPGVILGSRISRIIPERTLNWLFSVLYFSLGTRLVFS